MTDRILRLFNPVKMDSLLMLQAAGNHRKSQIVVCLEGGLKQGAYRKEDTSS